MSKTEELIDVLNKEKNKTLSDAQLASELNLSIRDVQVSIHQLMQNKKKFKNFSIARHGKYRNFSRELINLNTSENNILNCRDRHLLKGIKQFEISKKIGKIGLDTRQGIANRNFLLSRILNQNLKSMVQAQELLQ